ncbi:alpha/beta hydrolase [Tetragenococcus solitarius]|uniref:Alpha/beta fold hydrolase n=1 Tax=Tetragenococcus solitarius TaxID=71453 RepID=A0ABP6KTJ9_9ENTE|nr:alpha/beta hydrolase [Tetragenococcus solitarius]
MKKILFSISLLLAFLLVGCQNSNSAEAHQDSHANETNNTTKTSNATKSTQQTNKKSTMPTLFIHGYQGTTNSFKSMINDMQKNSVAQREMIVVVHSDGSIDVQGELSGKKTNPIIQVLFENNESDEWNQTEWIKNVLSLLKNDYQVDKVNLVGHSMGGVSAYRYMGTYGQEDTLPKIEKFVAIGAPFNEFVDTSESQSVEDLLKNGPDTPSQRYQDFTDLTPQIPNDTSVLLIAGQLSKADFTDGTVPLTSALSIYPLLENNGFNDISYSIIQGQRSSHSMLHENSKVNRQIEQFLWE